MVRYRVKCQAPDRGGGGDGDQSVARIVNLLWPVSHHTAQAFDSTGFKRGLLLAKTKLRYMSIMSSILVPS